MSKPIGTDDLVERLRSSTAFYHADCELKMACADRIEELEEMLMSATMDGYDMAKNEYHRYIEGLETKLKQEIKETERVDRVWSDNYAELEARVAKARVEGFWAGRSCGESKKAIDTALAKLLKGQDSE